MRPLEILILITLLPVFLGYLCPRSKRPGWLQLFSGSALMLMLLHFWFEKWRWQMASAYGLVVIACALAVRKAPDEARKDSDSWWRTTGRMAVVVLGLFVCVLTAFLALQVPVFRDPAPTGPFAIGSTRLYLVDSSRQDSFASHPHAPRELLVVVWYPAELTVGAVRQSFLPEVSVTGPFIAHSLHLPFFILSHLRLVKSHSYLDVPVAQAQAKYPVLIFSHGYGGTPWQNTPQMEELASHGFIIFSIGHTYESAAIAFPDGRIVPFSQTRFDAITGLAKSDRMKELTAQLQLTNNPLAIRQIATQMTQASGAQESLAVWVADTQYLMDELTKLNAGADGDGRQRFANRLDLTRLGIFGMSFGGATAGVVCMQDPRVKAGLNMDGKQSGDTINHKLSVPFFYFSSESSKEDRKINAAIYENSLADFYHVHVSHSAHMNFSDMSLISPILKNTSLLGSINGQEMEKIMSAYTLAFFQKYLQGKLAPLLEDPLPAGGFPDVVFATRRVSVTPPRTF